MTDDSVEPAGSDLRLQHARELLDLFAAGTADPDELVPWCPDFLALWKEVWASVKPLQRPVVTVEWITDSEYRPAARAAECLLALMGHFRGKRIGRILREALELTDPVLKMWAVVSLFRRNEPVNEEAVNAVAASHIVRITFFEQLQALGLESLMPERWAAPVELAAGALSRWLSRPNELNAIPEEIELMKSYPVECDDGEMGEAYLFRFREYPRPWEPGEGWMAGVAGPYRDGRKVSSPWSSFRRWDSMSPDEHFHMLHSNGTCYA